MLSFLRCWDFGHLALKPYASYGFWLVLWVRYTYIYTCGVFAFTLDGGVREIRQGRRISLDLSIGRRHSSNVGTRPFHKKVEKMPESFPEVVVNGLGSSRPPSVDDELQCEHYDACPGCSLKRAFCTAPAVADATFFYNSLLRREESVGTMYKCAPEFRVVIGKHHGWRTHAKLAVAPANKWGGIKIGLYSLGSHDVIPIPECRVHHPRINEAVYVIGHSAKVLKLDGYNESKMRGHLRYVQLTVERKSGKVQATLVWNANSFREATPELQLLVKKMNQTAPHLFHSVWANFRTGPGNTIFSFAPKSWHRCYGPEFIVEKLSSVPENVPTLYFSPPVFHQANLDAFEGVAAVVQRMVPKGSDVCELYAGMGLLGATVVRKSSRVRCSDLNPFGARAFSRWRAELSASLQGRISFENQSAEKALESGQADGSTCLIVDPPRRGLDNFVLKCLTSDMRFDPCTATVTTLVYVSCGLEAFKKDAMGLIRGGWNVKEVEGHVLFPGSDRVEIVALFER